ncbi:hypothetical protein L602_005300000110 [Cupriavidus gilardii J11]|uniref:Uncharacterized protein n=1 Tax=Cupriavidus gilardii J11 TaxID=936133 RepID=A0A562B516_9BURK|nr:hypothetical protein [Cupriavidus gilardii]TWG80236.1 hypothetical protein L602_005300000110 [Cupriavidus gilardii J11]
MTNDRQAGLEQPARAFHELDLDIPLGSLEAAAFAELPYTFQPSGRCAGFYQELFG